MVIKNSEGGGEKSAAFTRLFNLIGLRMGKGRVEEGGRITLKSAENKPNTESGGGRGGGLSGFLLRKIRDQGPWLRDFVGRRGGRCGKNGRSSLLTFTTLSKKKGKKKSRKTSARDGASRGKRKPQANPTFRIAFSLLFHRAVEREGKGSKGRRGGEEGKNIRRALGARNKFGRGVGV